MYLRQDDDWRVLEEKGIDYNEGTLFFEVALKGDRICAKCPEYEIEFSINDSTIKTGNAGFRCRGEATLYSLEIETCDVQDKINSHEEAKAADALRNFGSSIPDAREVAVKTIPESWKLLNISSAYFKPERYDFYLPGRNDFLFSTPDGLVAQSFDGEDLWRNNVVPVGDICISSEPAEDGAKLIYVLSGVRKKREATHVSGRAAKKIVADQMLVINGKNGEILAQNRLPDHIDVDYETFNFSLTLIG